MLTPGGGNWKFNLVEGTPVHIRMRGRDIRARPEIVTDVDELDRLLIVMAKGNPMIKRFVPIPQNEDGHFDQTRLRTAVKYGFRIVRWHPVNVG
jgi:hypothetical protein